MVPYLGLYFEHQGFGSSMIGVLLSIGPVASLFLRPFWGIVGDRAESGKRVLIYLVLAAAGTLWLYTVEGAFFYVFFVTILFFGFECAITPMLDAITLSNLEDRKASFSPIRLFGSIGYALIAAAAGRILELNIDFFVPLNFFLLSLAVLPLLSIPDKEQDTALGKPSLRSLLQLFTDRKLMLIYAFVFVLQSTSGFNRAFFSIYMRRLGTPLDTVGLSLMVASFSQYPFLIFADRMLAGLGIHKVLFVSGLIHAVRWLLMGTVVSSGNVIFIQLLHGMTYIVLYYSLALFVNQRVPDNLKVTGQMMNGTVLYGLSLVAGGTGGGVVAEHFSIGAVYMGSALLTLVASLLFLAYIIVPEEYSRRQNRESASGAPDGDEERSGADM